MTSIDIKRSDNGLCQKKAKGIKARSVNKPQKNVNIPAGANEAGGARVAFIDERPLRVFF